MEPPEEPPEPETIGFPRELLEQSIEARYNYFVKKVVKHNRLKEVRHALLHTIRYPAGASLILVYGPTGVGKTTLRKGIEKQLVKEALADPTTNPGHIPVVSLDAVSPDSGIFNWRDYYIRALAALGEPLIREKIVCRTPGFEVDKSGRLMVERAVTVPDLRRVLEQCLQYRQPRAILVDEGQHFQKMASGRRLLDQMDSLKSLATMTQTTHVFLGPYDLLKLTDLSAQLSRRSIEIHFPRYYADQEEDLEEFKRVLRLLQLHLPLPETPDLEAHYEEFYERTLGCIGLLKDWLNRALAKALVEKKKPFTWNRWKKYAEPTRRLQHIKTEIKYGEDTLKEDESQLHELRRFLKLDLDPPPESPPPPTTPQPPKGSGGGPGRRNAKHDPVGGGQLAG